MSKNSLQSAPLISELQNLLNQFQDQSEHLSEESSMLELSQLINGIQQKIQSALKENIFSAEKYQLKLQKLLSYSEEIKIEVLKDLPRDSEIIVTKTYIKRKSSKFSKIAIIKATNTKTGQVWYQPIEIQEFDQLDKHAASKEIGQEFLPIRLSNGKLEVAISLRNPVGALGSAIFYCSGGSNSRPVKSIFQTWPAHQLVLLSPARRDANRLSGQIKNGLALVSESDLDQIDEVKEKIVWFNLAELSELQKEPQFADAITKHLCQYVLNHQPEIEQKIQGLL